MTHDRISREQRHESHRETAPALVGESKENDYAAKGARCDRETVEGCEWDSDRREREVAKLQARIARVSTTVADAVQQVRVDKLMKKPEEVPFFSSLIIEAIGAVLTGPLTAIAGGVVKYAGTKLNSVAPAAAAKLSAVSPEKINAVVGGAVGKGTTAAKDDLEDKNAAKELDQKAVATDFLALLYNQYSKGFEALQEQLPSNATDVELEKLIRAFASENHKVEEYAKAIADKLAAYEASRIASIGRTRAKRDTNIAPSFAGVEVTLPSRDVIRDTRVVWHEYVSGYPKDLVIEFQDGSLSPSFTQSLDFAAKAARSGGKPNAGKATFGAERPVMESPGFGVSVEKSEYGPVIPRELHALALSRHEASWGDAPQTRLIDDSNSFDPMRIAAAMKNKAKARKESQ